MNIFTHSVLAFALLGSVPAFAHDPQPHGATEMHAAGEVVQFGDLEISGAFTRATLPNAPVAGGYLTVTNTGETDERLVGGSASFAGRVEIHEMAVVNDIMNMRQLPDGLTIPAGETVTLEPGGLHLMFMQLQQPLVEGTPVTITLDFESAGTVEVEFAVGGMGARTAPDHSGHGSHGGHDANDHEGHDAPEAHGPHDAHHGHAGPGHFDQSTATTDEEAIAGLLKSIFETPENPLDIQPIVIEGEYAIAGWAQDGTGGRALLRKTESRGWGVHLCAGDGLKVASNLVQIGIPQAEAGALADKLAVAEGQLDPAHVALFSLFDGTVIVEPDLI